MEDIAKLIYVIFYKLFHHNKNLTNVNTYLPIIQGQIVTPPFNIVGSRGKYFWNTIQSY